MVFVQEPERGKAFVSLVALLQDTENQFCSASKQQALLKPLRRWPLSLPVRLSLQR